MREPLESVVSERNGAKTMILTKNNRSIQVVRSGKSRYFKSLENAVDTARNIGGIVFPGNGIALYMTPKENVTLITYRDSEARQRINNNY